MYRSPLRIPRQSPVVVPDENCLPDETAAAAAELEAAATLASRTSVGSETLGADGKAAIVLTMLGIMFTVLARFGAELGALLRHGVGTGTGVVRTGCAVLLLGFVVCALGAVLQAFRTIMPRFRKDKPSLAFFAEIARMDRSEYAARVESLTMRQAVDEIIRYNHTAAAICAEKFKQLGRCFRFFEIGSACWVLLVAVVVLKSLNG